MYWSFLRILLFAGSCFLTVSTAHAQPTSMTVEPGAEVIIDTGPGGLVAPSFTQPLHGTLTAESTDLRYVPSPSFWTIGADQVTYTPFGVGALPVHVFIVPQDQGTSWFSHGFEGSGLTLPAEMSIAGSPTASTRVTKTACLPLVTCLHLVTEGANGLAFAAGPGDVFLKIDPGGPGGNGHGSGGGQTDVDPPWPPGGGAPLAWPNSWRLMGFGAATATSEPPIELRMRPMPNEIVGYEVLLRHVGEPAADDPSHSWFFVGDGPRRYEVRFWLSNDDPVTGSYELRVDGKVVDTHQGLPGSPWPNSEMLIGLNDMPSDGIDALEIDHVEAWDSPWLPGRDLLRGETFENGVPVDLTLSSPGAVATAVSSFGAGNALIVVPGPDPAWARDTLPDTTAVGVRMSLRTADLTFSSGTYVKVLDLAGYNAGVASRAEVWLSRDTGSETLILKVRDDSSAVTAGTPVPIDASGETIELIWQASTGEHASNGHAALYVDGIEQVLLTGLDTDEQKVRAVTVGAAKVTGTVSGSVMIDDLVIVEAP